MWAVILFVPVVLTEAGVFTSLDKIYGGEVPNIIRSTVAWIFIAVGVVVASYLMGPALREGRLENEREARADPQKYKKRRVQERVWAALVLIVIFIIVIALRSLSKK